MSRAVLSGVVETVYPRTCAGCGLRGVWLCTMCEEAVAPATVRISCSRCGVPVISRRCGCLGLPMVVSRARAAYVYDGWVATAVKRAKYEGEWARLEPMAAMMTGALAELGPVDCLIPVPLHPARERDRGYNQSRVLAEHLGSISGVPIKDVLRRTRQTVPQVTLSGRERGENVSDAFECDPSWVPVPGGRYVIVDDVHTTGATVGACAAALQAVRPASVGVLTFALDLPRDRVLALNAYLEAEQVRSERVRQ